MEGYVLTWNNVFADNDVTIQWLYLSGKIVHKANCLPGALSFTPGELPKTV